MANEIYGGKIMYIIRFLSLILVLLLTIIFILQKIFKNMPTKKEQKTPEFGSEGEDDVLPTRGKEYEMESIDMSAIKGLNPTDRAV